MKFSCISKGQDGRVGVQWFFSQRDKEHLFRFVSSLHVFHIVMMSLSTFQLRKLKERRKTEVNPSRMEQKSSRQISKRSSLWFGESAFRNKVVEKGVGDKERIFEEMVAEVKRSSNRREDTPDSDCEKYFSDD